MWNLNNPSEALWKLSLLILGAVVLVLVVWVAYSERRIMKVEDYVYWSQKYEKALRELEGRSTDKW